MAEAVGGSAARSRVRLSGIVKPFWRSPPDQPPWARPALLAIAAVAAAGYAWGLNGDSLENFYGAAARSMSESWHDFIFGAFDPLGTVTVDKLPGALWLQALSLRVFGFHVWAVVLPQVIEGTLTILVLYRAVRRLAGPVGAITAAAVLASSPVTIALNRGDVGDSLLILLTVLAADATVSALIDGRLGPLIGAGVWVGLAFQAKMLQAWLILPALAVAYLVAAPPRLRTRVGHVAVAGAVTVAVSLSWMTAVSLVPAHDRPYVDGTQDDSVFSQVFDYNGIARLGHGSVLGGAGRPAPFLARLAQAGSSGGNPAKEVPPSWHRLLSGLFGRDVAWLLPAALICAAAVLLARRGTGRRDPLRATVLLWGTWLVILSVFFSEGVYLNSYYVAALAPAIAALCGAGVALAWPRRGQPAARGALAATVIVSVGYGVYLLDGGTGVPGWLAPTAICLGVAGALAALAARRSAGASDPARDATGASDSTGPAVALAIGCALLLPAVAAALIVTRGLGPFAAPYEPASATVSRASARHTLVLNRQVVDRVSSDFQTPIVLAADSSRLAAPYILATGREVLPIGGYEGGGPSPGLDRLRRYIESGQVRAFLLPVSSEDPRIVWIHTHCTTESTRGRAAAIALYDCGPHGG
jgi:4-amino-4-deoxy-L-arabinose transferase-like glycosyltransferase